MEHNLTRISNIMTVNLFQNYLFNVYNIFSVNLSSSASYLKLENNILFWTEQKVLLLLQNITACFPMYISDRDLSCFLMNQIKQL